MPDPEISSMVLFRDGAELRPAIVTRVHDPNLVNLVVIMDLVNGVFARNSIPHNISADSSWLWPSEVPP